MHIVLIYASIEGQTRKIASHIASFLNANHHSCDLLDATDDHKNIELLDVDGVIICAPVHTGHFPKALHRLVKNHLTKLMALPGAFISVSLAMASNDKADAAEIDKIVFGFSEDTGWWPVVTHNAAGALKYSEYDYFKKWMMKRISRKSNGPTDTSQDYEFTDWNALDEFVLQFVDDAPASKNKI